jgi:hypothetical protein
MSETQKPDDIIDVEPTIIGETKAEGTRPKMRMWMRFAPPVALALVAAVAGGWVYRDLLSNYLPSDQVQALSKRLATIESGAKDNQKRVDAVVALTEEFKAKLSAAQAAADKSSKFTAETAALLQGNGSDIAALKQDFEKLSAATSELQSKIAAGGVASAPDAALNARLAQLEKQLSAAPAAVAAEPGDQTAALKMLKGQIAQGQNFAATLAPLARALPAAPGLDALGAERMGLATSASLASELDGLRASLPKPSAAAEESGIWASIKGVFSRMVKVRGQNSDDWATLAAKASAFAAAGDLDQATALFAKAGTDMPAPLKAWAEKAQRRLNLEKGLTQFSAALIRAGLAKE